MSASLIFHSPDRTHVQPSPFEDALAKVVASGRTLLLASPYLSLPMLSRLVSEVSQFRLLTDAEEWIRTTKSADRERVVTFCDRYVAQVRHARGLHAKVFATDRLAMLGSANLTFSGFEELEEMSILVEDQTLVGQLVEWHVGLWDRAAVIDTNLLGALAKELPERSVGLPTVGARLPGLRALPRTRNPTVPTPPQLGEDDAIKQLSARQVSETWLSSYLDAVRLLYDRLAVHEDDARLALTLPKHGDIPLSINNRYVIDCLQAPRRGKLEGLSEPPIRLLIPAKLIGLQAKSWRGGSLENQFKPRSKDETDPPIAVLFESIASLSDPRIREAWLDGCELELTRGARSSNRKYHSVPLLRAALDASYRGDLFQRIGFAR